MIPSPGKAHPKNHSTHKENIIPGKVFWAQTGQDCPLPPGCGTSMDANKNTSLWGPHSMPWLMMLQSQIAPSCSWKVSIFNPRIGLSIYITVQGADLYPLCQSVELTLVPRWLSSYIVTLLPASSTHRMCRLSIQLSKWLTFQFLTRFPAWYQLAR